MKEVQSKIIHTHSSSRSGLKAPPSGAKKSTMKPNHSPKPRAPKYPGSTVMQSATFSKRQTQHSNELAGLTNSIKGQLVTDPSTFSQSSSSQQQKNSKRSSGLMLPHKTPIVSGNKSKPECTLTPSGSGSFL